MNKNLLVTFENKDIEVLVLDEQILFNPYDVAECLDMTESAVRMAISKMNENQVKTVRNSNVKDIDFRKLANRGENFLTESGLYKLIFKSHKEEAERFQDWVTDEVLPTLRKSGVVVLEHAEPEAIDYQAKYGKYRIRKTFSESNDLRATYEEFAALSKIEREAKRIDNKDRIKSCKIIINVLEEKIANEVLTLRASELIAIQELIGDIQYDITKLSNKLNGGKKSAMTKRINKLESENEELKNQFFDIDWKKINNHGFTENCKLEYDPNLKRMVRTRAFRSWLNNFDYSDFRELNCDVSRPMTIYLHFGKLEKFDTSNLEKSAIDLIADRYDFDDNLIINKVTSSETVNSYQEGFILFDLVNIDNE